MHNFILELQRKSFYAWNVYAWTLHAKLYWLEKRTLCRIIRTPPILNNGKTGKFKSHWSIPGFFKLCSSPPSLISYIRTTQDVHFVGLHSQNISAHTHRHTHTCITTLVVVSGDRVLGLNPKLYYHRRFAPYPFCIREKKKRSPFTNRVKQALI